MEVLELQIKNWERFNPRSDAKSCSWFRMSNTFFNDPEFYGVSLEVRMVWVFLLCTASQKMSGTVKVNTQMVADNLKIRIESVDYAINELLHIGSVCNKATILVSMDCDPNVKTKLLQVTFRNERNVTNATNEHNVTNEEFTPPVETVVVDPKKLPKKKSNIQPLTQTTWESYKKAYAERYGVDPVRNASVNSKIKQFVERVGVEESPDVARFYVHHNSQKYIASGHSVGNMLFDAEKLRTEWARGRQITAAEARHTENKQQLVNVFERHLNASGGQNG